MNKFDFYAPIFDSIGIKRVQLYELYGFNSRLISVKNGYYRKRKHLCKR